MSDDEMDRRMEFIVEQQAQFAADIQILKERQTAFQGEIEKLTAAANVALETSTKAAEAVGALTAVANTALDTSTKTAEVVTTLAQTMSDAQAETQRQISRLASLLVDHMRVGHPPDVPAS